MRLGTAHQAIPSLAIRADIAAASAHPGPQLLNPKLLTTYLRWRSWHVTAAAQPLLSQRLTSVRQSPDKYEPLTSTARPNSSVHGFAARRCQIRLGYWGCARGFQQAT